MFFKWPVSVIINHRIITGQAEQNQSMQTTGSCTFKTRTSIDSHAKVSAVCTLPYNFAIDNTESRMIHRYVQKVMLIYKPQIDTTR